MPYVSLMKAMVLAVIMIGLLGLLLKRNLLLRILAMDVMGTGIISFFVLSAARGGQRTPTVEEDGVLLYADPVPQAVILTAIVIGFSVMALVLVKAMALARQYPTLDGRAIENEEEDKPCS